MQSSPITFIPSPNMRARESDVIDMLILHYTETPNAADALSILTNPERQVSAHYLVDVDGTIIQMVPEDMRASHAGVSYWRGDTNINCRSIGIEIQNEGHSKNCPVYPKIQINALMRLCHDILKRNKNITPARILAHSDIAPRRKCDPGEHFPWQYLAKNGIGFWPEPETQSDDNLDDLILAAGYDPQASIEQRRIAFFRHYYPKGIKKPATPQRLSEAASLAKALIEVS